jgi:hypothetical protein
MIMHDPAPTRVDSYVSWELELADDFNHVAVLQIASGVLFCSETSAVFVLGSDCQNNMQTCYLPVNKPLKNGGGVSDGSGLLVLTQNEGTSPIQAELDRNVTVLPRCNAFSCLNSA